MPLSPTSTTSNPLHRDLSYNQITQLDRGCLAGLSMLESLYVEGGGVEARGK